MSRTYRRKNVEIRFKKDHIWYSYNETPSWNVYGARGRWDWENNWGTNVEGEDFDYRKVIKDINRYRSDAGTYKSYKYLKKMLNKRYREQSKTLLNEYLRKVDGELQLNRPHKFEGGYYWD